MDRFGLLMLLPAAPALFIAAHLGVWGVRELVVRNEELVPAQAEGFFPLRGRWLRYLLAAVLGAAVTPPLFVIVYWMLFVALFILVAPFGL